MQENQEIIKTPLTNTVIYISIIAGSAGLMFGYDTAVIGGVMMMRPFLEKFYPSVLVRMMDAKEDQYCLFDSHKLAALISSMFISGFVSSLLAGRLTSVIGRKLSLVTSGILVLMGNALGVFADNVDMLIVSRLFVGFGIGFGNQVFPTGNPPEIAISSGFLVDMIVAITFSANCVFQRIEHSHGLAAAPAYITEMAPTKWRGTLTTAFQFFICLGGLIASLINFFANNSGSNRGWRLALGGGSVPAIILTIGALFIPDTPSSLIQRGKQDEAQAALTKVRSTRAEAEAELKDLINYSEAVKLNQENPYVKLMDPRYRPQLVLTMAIAGFQKFTGVGMVAFYAPVVMRTVGIEAAWSLLSAVVLGIVNLGAVLISAYMVDKIGRRLLFLQGGVQIIFSQVFITCTLALQSQRVVGMFPYNYGIVVLVLMCLITAAFGWSWGPLTWLVPSEILPVEVRAAGTGISVATNFLVTFLLTQFSLAMLCSMKFGLFLFYGATTFFMTTFIGVFLPETKGVPLESMKEVWGKHWYWKWSVSM